MDSQSLNQAAKKMNGSDHSNVVNKIDLTLKLGLPDGDHENQQMTPYHANLDIDVLYSYEGIINNYKIVKEGMNMANVGQGLMPNGVAWPQSSLLMETQSQYSHAQAPYMSSNNSYDISPPPLPCYYPNNNINPNHNIQFAAAATTEAAGVMNDYIILDIPPRRADREMRMRMRMRIGGSSARKRATAGMRRSRGVTFIDPYKICTNVNCNTNTTPMWRRGPLGPKSLCNACGIKYRKEEEKRMISKNVDKSSAETA